MFFILLIQFNCNRKQSDTESTSGSTHSYSLPIAKAPPLDSLKIAPVTENDVNQYPHVQALQSQIDAEKNKSLLY